MSGAAPGVGPPEDVPDALLTPTVYVDEMLFDWERRNLFDASWVCVARSEELKNGGDQFAESIGATAILYLRGADGILRGFVNTCRHEGTQLLPCGEAVNCDVVLCRGHAWTYGLDGSLLSVPAHEAGGVYIDKAAHALHRVATAEWLGLVFSNVDSSRAGAGFDDLVGELADLLAPHGLERAIVAGWREYLVAANWKLVLASAPVSPAGPDRKRWPSSRVGRGAWHHGDAHASSAGVFPNLLVGAGHDACVTYLLVPRGVRETVVLCDWAFSPESFDGPGFDPASAIEARDASNRAAWQRAESLHAQLEAAALAGEDVSEPVLEDAVARILGERYAVASPTVR